MEKYKKIDESTIEFSKVIPQEIIVEKTEKVKYDYDFLVTQKVAVETDLANLVAQHAIEIEVAEDNIAEVVSLLAECAKLGVDGVKPVVEEASLQPAATLVVEKD